MQLDIIGDVHGHADALEVLLGRLGYRVANGAFRHPGGRRAVFLGDLVDRGPDQLRSIAIVRAMIEGGTADIVMGNHELNAIAYATPHPTRPGDHLRSRQGTNVSNHAAFLAEAGGADGPRHRDLVSFFAEMPLWLDLDGLRIVHACWSPAAIATLAPHVDAGHRLTETGLLSVLTRRTPAHAACDVLLKGPEVRLPRGVSYRDGHDQPRKTTRTRWWDAGATTLHTGAVERSVVDQVPDDPLPPECLIALDQDRPVIFGHYCMDEVPHLLSPRRTCLDFCVARGGALCAYRFDGEPDLDPGKLVWVA